MARKRVPVNELLLRDMIAGEVSLPTENSMQVTDQKPFTCTPEETNSETTEEKENYKPNKKKKEQLYEDVYLAYRPINRKDRQQTYIDNDIHEKFTRFLKVVGDRKMSMTTFINNILRHHWETNYSTIKQLYDNSVNKSLD